MASDQRELLLKVKVDDDASKPLKRIGDAADDAADDLQEMNVGLKKLDDKVSATTKVIADLRAEVAKTGDLELIKDITKQEARLKALEKQRKILLGDTGDARKAGKDQGEALVDGIADGLKKDADAEEAGRSIGRKVGDGISGGLGNLGSKVTSPLGKIAERIPPQVQAAIGAGVAVAAVAASSVIGAAVGGAVVGGAAGVGIIGGIKIAAKDPRVQAAAKLTGDTISDVLEDSASAFVPATVTALGHIRSEVKAMGPELERVFDKAAVYVKPLSEGATGFFRNLLPGLEAAVDKAGPIIDELSSWGPKLGTLIGDVLREFSELGPEGARALELLFDTADTGIRMLVDQLTTLARVFGWIGAQWDLIQRATGQTDQAIRKVGPAGDEAKRGLDAAGLAAGAAAVKIETLAEMTQRLTNDNISAERAQLALEAAIDRATEAGARNNAGIDRTTKAGAANREILLGLADASNVAYASILKQTGSQELATAAAVRGRQQFLSAARAMGVGAAEAGRLADQLFALPANTPVKVTADTKQASGAISALKARIASIDRRIDIKARMTVSYGGGAHTGQGYSTGYSQGGPVHGPGPKGVDSKRALLAPGEHVITADEVDAAGGHQAVEEWRRSLRAGSRSAGTVGGGAVGVAAQQQVQVVLRFEGNDRGILAAFMRAIKDAGGNPKVLGLGGVW